MMTGYCNGHLVQRHAGRKASFWTVDDFDRRFENLTDAAFFARSLAHATLPTARFFENPWLVGSRAG